MPIQWNRQPTVHLSIQQQIVTASARAIILSIAAIDLIWNCRQVHVLICSSPCPHYIEQISDSLDNLEQLQSTNWNFYAGFTETNQVQ